MTGPQSVSGKPSIRVPRTSAMTPDRLEPRRRRRRAHANEGIVQAVSKQNFAGSPADCGSVARGNPGCIGCGLSVPETDTARARTTTDASRRVRRIFTTPRDHTEPVEGRRVPAAFKGGRHGTDLPRLACNFIKAGIPDRRAHLGGIIAALDIDGRQLRILIRCVRQPWTFNPYRNSSILACAGLSRSAFEQGAAGKSASLCRHFNDSQPPKLSGPSGPGQRSRFFFAHWGSSSPADGSRFNKGVIHVALSSPVPR